MTGVGEGGFSIRMDPTVFGVHGNFQLTQKSFRFLGANLLVVVALVFFVSAGGASMWLLSVYTIF